MHFGGVIRQNTLAQFQRLHAENPGIRRLNLHHVPGSVGEFPVTELGYQLRQLGFHTHLFPHSEIYSGGVDLFLAGSRRTMAAGALLGVHGWRTWNTEARDFPRDHPEHDVYVRYTADMLGNDAFYWFTIAAAGADDIYVMNRAEIVQYGLITG